MAHTHPVIDSDTHFKIDGATRTIKNEAEVKSMLVQYDHKSERFTFEVPRFVDGHDLSLCNVVRAHFCNVEKNRRTENKGCCDITDLAVCPEDSNYVTCSWLVPSDATQLVGSLHFVIQFACFEGKEVLYSWNTVKYTSIVIAEGIDGGEAIVSEYNDTLMEWKEQLEANQITNIEQTTTSTEDGGENVWTATFGDGRTQELKVRNGSRGATGLVGSIQTIQGNTLHFFVGTQAEYEALTDEKKVNLFAIITDDTAREDIKNEIIKAIEDGKVNVPRERKYLHQLCLTRSQGSATTDVLLFNVVVSFSTKIDNWDAILNAISSAKIMASGYVNSTKHVWAVSKAGVTLWVWEHSSGYSSISSTDFNNFSVVDTVIEL